MLCHLLYSQLFSTHGDCGCFKTQQCAMFLRTENASRLYGIWSLHTFVSQLTAVWNKHASLGLTQTGCLRLLGIHSSFVTSCTADYSPHSPTTSEPQHGDCGCFKTQQCAMFLRTENASRLYGIWSLHTFVSQLTAVWNKHASLGLTQTGCLRLLGIHSSFVTSCTADYSPHSPTTSEPQHGDCQLL